PMNRSNRALIFPENSNVAVVLAFHQAYQSTDIEHWCLSYVNKHHFRCHNMHILSMSFGDLNSLVISHGTLLQRLSSLRIATNGRNPLSEKSLLSLLALSRTLGVV